MPRQILPTGLTLDYVDLGPRDGTPIVLLHGWTDSWRIWEGAFPYFDPRLRLIAPTHRGFGDSDKPGDGYAMSDFVADAAEFTDALGLEKFALAGHSMGGFIAHQFAVEYPGRLTRLGLVGTGTTGHDKPAFHDDAVGLHEIPDPLTQDYVRDAQALAMRLPVPDERFATVVHESLKAPQHVWVQSWIGMQNEDHVGRLAEIAVPTFIQCGDDDIYFPVSEQDELQAAIRGSTLKLYPGAGHGLQWELPQAFARDLSDFVLT